MYNSNMKGMNFLGDSLERLREFPEGVRHDVGRALNKVQHGEQPTDFKEVPAIGPGVREIRVWDESGTYRVLYVAKMANSVYVLSAFQKKTEATPKSEVNLAKKRYNELIRSKND